MTTGSVKNKKRIIQNDEEREWNVLLYFQENPNSSIPNAVRELHYSCGTIYRILKKHKMKAYKILPVQKLSLAHIQSRLDYCNLMLGRLQGDPNFFKRIIWTDESTFSTAGVFNRKNTRLWASENPGKIAEIKVQGRQSLHLWCGVLQNQIIGPIFLNENLTGRIYNDLLQNEISQRLQQANLPRNVIWQQDGAPPHNTVAVRNFLNETYDEWIGRSGTILWPANSPDLSPLDTFVWGFLKNKIYADPINNLEILRNKIREEIVNLNNNPEIIENSLRNLQRRYQLCFEHRGHHFEQFL